MRNKIIGLLSLVLFSSLFQPQLVYAQKNELAIAPIISLLFEDQRANLQVGKPYLTPLSSSAYPDGFEFSFNSLQADIMLEIVAENIEGAMPPSLFIDGNSVGTITNGSNIFNLDVNSLSTNSVFSIAFENDSVGTWTVTRIHAVLSFGPRNIAEAQRLLMRASFGPNQAELDRVLSIGYEAWIDEQIALTPTLTEPLWHQYVENRLAARTQDYIDAGVTDTNILNYQILGATSRFTTRMDTWWQASLKGNDQLRQRVAYAYSQIFNVTETNPDLIPYFHDTLVKNAFANYEDLLREVSLTPMMGTYLGMLGNIRATTGDFPTVPDENFAREIMQLFSIGLIELNLDGTPKLQGGKTIDTYDQTTIKEFARVFTGWTSNPEGFRTGWEFNPMKVDSQRIQPGNIDKHDDGQKILLNGEVIPAGLSTEEDFNRAIRNIAQHPNVGPYFGRLLIQRLVKSNPSSGYIERVATVFNDNGNGVRGDMGAVIKAILTDTEALNGEADVSGGKIKEPIIAITQLWRALNATSSIGYFRYTRPLLEFGQQPYGAPTVFGFYEPDFTPQGEFETRGLVAPEFNLLTDNVVGKSLNRMYELVSGLRYGESFTSVARQSNGQNITVNHTRFNGNLSATVNLNLSALMNLAQDTEVLINRLDELFLGGLMSDALRTPLRRHLNSLFDESTVLNTEQREVKVREALSLLVVSPEYHTQR